MFPPNNGNPYQSAPVQVPPAPQPQPQFDPAYAARFNIMMQLAQAGWSSDQIGIILGNSAPALPPPQHGYQPAPQMPAPAPSAPPPYGHPQPPATAYQQQQAAALAQQQQPQMSEAERITREWQANNQAVYQATYGQPTAPTPASQPQQVIGQNPIEQQMIDAVRAKQAGGVSGNGFGPIGL